MKLFIYFIICSFLITSCAFKRDVEQRSLASSSSCNQLIKNFVKEPEKLPDYFNGEVEIIWWPRAITKVITHTDIRIGSPIYSAFLGLSKTGDFHKKYARAISGEGKPFFRFKLAVSKEEFLRLKSIVDDADNYKKRRLQTCIGGACKMLRENTEINIPFPFSQVPTLNALYLMLLKRLGHKKILKVEYVGPNAWQTFLKYEPVVELGLSATAVGLIVWSVNKYGEAEQTVIPISELEFQ